MTCAPHARDQPLVCDVSETSSPQTALRLMTGCRPHCCRTTLGRCCCDYSIGGTYLWSPPSSGARGHSCLGLRTGVSPHFSTNSMRAMVAAQRQCVIGSELVRCSGDAAERPAGPRRPPAGSWRAAPATLRARHAELHPRPRAAHVVHSGGRIAATAARLPHASRAAPRTVRDLRNFTAEFYCPSAERAPCRANFYSLRWTTNVN